MVIRDMPTKLHVKNVLIGIGVQQQVSSGKRLISTRIHLKNQLGGGTRVALMMVRAVKQARRSVDTTKKRKLSV
jgi:hypothetical protein